MTVKDAAVTLTKDDINLVQNFAKDTGDYKSLSFVDQQVIALGVHLARQKGELD